MRKPSITVACGHCEKLFHPRPSLVKSSSGLYCCKECFRLARVVPLHERFWLNVKKSRGCWLWQGGTTAKGGYGKISEGPQGGKTLLAHRVSWELYNGPIPNGMDVLHHCDNPPCVRPDHLFVGTQADNNADKVSKNRQARGSRAAPKNPAKGETHHNAKLNDALIQQIRGFRKAGLSQQTIADGIGVSQSAISRVLIGKWWKHVK